VALINCRECGELISSKAFACLECGLRTPSLNRERVKWVIVCVFGAFWLYYMWDGYRVLRAYEDAFRALNWPIGRHHRPIF